MEVKHQSLIGGTLRDAETANMAALERLEARKREGKKPAPKAKPRGFEHREITKKEVATAGVTRKAPTPRKLIPPSCKFCGTCKRCKSLKRVAAILRKARMGDADMLPLALELVGLEMAERNKSDYRDALGVEYPFSRIAGFTASRAVNAGVESVCDRSVRLLGGWR